MKTKKASPNMGHVFISYSRKDIDFAQQVKKEIEDAGFEHWIDGDQLKAGQNWPTEIRNAIDTSYALIVIKSPSSYESQYVTFEWSYARGAGVPMIPLLYEQQIETNAFIEDIQHLDFTDIDPQKWENLFAMLREKQKEYRIKVRVPKDAPPNVRAALDKLNSHFPEDVMSGIKLLERLQHPSIVPGLIISLNNQDNNVMNAAFHALIKFDDIGVPQLLEELGKIYENDDNQFRIASILSHIKSEMAFEGLLSRTWDPRNRIRYFAIYAVNQMQRKEALPRLLQLIHDEDSIIRSEVLGALTQIGDKEFISIFVDALEDDDKDVRTTAVNGLSKIGGKTVILPLIKALQDEAFYVRLSAARALGEIDDGIAINQLFNLSKDSSPDIRRAGLDALNRIYNRIGLREAMEAIQKWPTIPKE